MRRLFYIVCSLFPVLAFASSGTDNSTGSSLSFAPPPTDSSVVFLGNIFGVVDGVLHGTGSQIMGTMFGVFNSAVLALGGIIIMYTLMVSTMNTAHEGQMLGQKWSSIWVPMRSTLGLALLIPKASGYCLMQIFVMWIVVQGVGAADKIWSAALGYLNRGGVIIQEQASYTLVPPSTGTNNPAQEIEQGATTILAGQVCMLGIQSVLETQRQNYLDAKQNGSGPCANTPSGPVQTFCNTPVPDFLSTVNVVSVQNNSSTVSNQVLMPNFDNNTPYQVLNGICGRINWDSSSTLLNTDNNTLSLSSSELTTANMSRAIAIQQMYIDLSTVARVMVNNNPELNPQQNNTNSSANTQTPAAPFAQQQFGVPFLTSGTPCTSLSPDCQSWGADSFSTSAPLFSGTEFWGAINDYNGIMLPTLTLAAQQKAQIATESEKSFIQNANAQGWMLAGSYFFNLIYLNNINTIPGLVDKDTGMTGSQLFDPSNLLSPFTNGQCGGEYADLCQWLNKNPDLIQPVIALINGSSATSAQPLASLPNFSSMTQSITPAVGSASSTTYGFITNSLIVNLPGQQGIETPKFQMTLTTPAFTPNPFQLKTMNFPCGPKFLSHCIEGDLLNALYNTMVVGVFNSLIKFITPIAGQLIQTFIVQPALSMATIFQSGVSIIEQTQANPILALATMGVAYINFSSELWLNLMGFAVSTALIPLLGQVIFVVVALGLPILLAWMGIMLSIGFITAYYVPFLPYMIFTFGTIAWLVSVIEAMVAAPIVALGVTHPEGHEAFGKGEQAIMIMMNVFLRPAMMIIGYVAAIALSYVSVWIINAGFSNAMAFFTQVQTTQINAPDSFWPQGTGSSNTPPGGTNTPVNTSGYTGWAALYAYFFSILIYTTMYLLVVQKAFNLIVYLPDRVLRWIGGQEEKVGQEAAQWTDEAKRQVEGAGDKTMKASQQADQQMAGYGMKAIGAAKDKIKSMTGGGGVVDSTPGPVPE